MAMAQNEFMHQALGPHLMLDLFGCPKERLKDVDFISNVLDTFPAKIGLTKLLPPHVFKYQGHDPHDWGVSGVALVAQAHISIHTFPESQHAFIDIFSCKDFDINAARELLLELFESNGHEQSLLNRGQVRSEKKDLAASRSILH